MQKKFKYFLLFLFFGGYFTNIHAQIVSDYPDFSFFFGDEQKTKTNIESLAELQNGKLVCVQNKSSFIRLFSKNKWQYSFDLIENYTCPKLKPVHFYGLGKKTSLVDYTLVGNKVLAISYRSSFGGKDPSLYYHYIDPAMSAKNNHGFPLQEFRAVHGKPDLSRITMRSEKDGNYATLLYSPNSVHNEFTTMEYAIFNRSQSTPVENSFVYPYPSNEFKIVDFFTFNPNKQVLITAHYPEKGTFNGSKSPFLFLKKININVINNGQSKDPITIENPSVYYLNIKAYAVDHVIYVTGLYSSNDSGDIQGIMTAEIDSTGQLKSEKLTPYDNSFHQAMRMISEGKSYQESHEQSEASGYRIIGFYPLSKGYVQVAEYNATEYRYNAGDFYGGTSTVDTYYWSNNLIITKVGWDGKLKWTRIIPKTQRSVNDHGYFLSTAAYANKDSLHLFFNDNIENYDDDHQYNILGDEPEQASFSTSKNTIAHVSVDLKSGDLLRTNIMGKEESDVYFVPQLSLSIPEQEKVMVGGRRGNRQRIGVLNFH